MSTKKPVNEVDEIKKAQAKYEKFLARQAWTGRFNALILILLFGCFVLVGLHFMREQPSPKDCSNPRNVNTPYCTEKKGQVERDWKSIVQGDNQGFGLNDR